MQYDEAIKILASGSPIRRKVWRKHWKVLKLVQVQSGQHYMVIPAIDTHQLVTFVERKATDWERAY